MKNKFFYNLRYCALLLIIFLSALTASCDIGINDPKQTGPGAETGPLDFDQTVAQVTITVDKERIPSSGAEPVYITAAAANADGAVIENASFEFYAQGKPLNSSVFYASEPGFYNLYAFCNEIRSNVIEVYVFDSDIARVSLYAGSTTIAAGERLNTVVNSYNTSGNRSTRKGELYADGSLLDSRSYESDEPGLHILYAVVQNVRSQPFAVLVTGDKPPDAQLTLGAAENYILLGQTVSFTATFADSGGNSLSCSIDDCRLYKIENDYITITEITGSEYTPKFPGKYSFFAVYRGTASRTFTLTVNDPNAPTYTGEDSDIPVVVIDTHGQELSAEYTRVTVYIYDSGSKNKYTDKPAIVTEAEIRWRGQSSMGFIKKQFALHTITYNGANNNLPLLGLPKENDWVLNGSYADKSLIRNGYAYNLFGLTCGYAPRAKYCEVYVNTSDNPNNKLNYQGVYSLIEKIKPDANRVNIHKLTPQDNSGDEITGGYIVSIDKHRATDYYFGTEIGTFVLSSPSNKNITTEQRKYITDYINDFTRALRSKEFTDPEIGYRKYLDVDSTARHLAVTELLRDVDGFIISTYFYKPRGGLLYAGPAWDYDLSLGNADYNGGEDSKGWYVTSMPLSRYLLRDPFFHQYYIDVWQEMREGVLRDENLVKLMDEQVAMMGNALARSLERWPAQWDGRTYVWPNLMGDKYRATHEQEIASMKKFIQERAAWIDSHIEGASW